MRLFASSVNRPDVNDLFPCRVRKASPGKSEQTKCNQDYPKRLVHGASLVAVASSEGHSDHRQFPQAEQRALRIDRFVYFSNTGPMQDMDRIKPVIQAFLANAERLINAAKDVHKPSPLSLPW